MLESGIKDCTKCLLPHSPGGHQYVVEKLKEYFGKVKKEKAI
jgi:Zn-finger protein